MKTIRKFIAAVLSCLILAGCTTSTDADGVRTFQMPVENNTSPVTLTLTESNETFQIAFPSSKILPYGKYSVSDDILTCTTLDKVYVFRFEVIDEHTLKFIAEGSSESIVDGSIFTEKLSDEVSSY